MLKCCSLYSGSTGNSFFVQSDSTKILIDVGVSLRKIENALSSLNVTLKNIDAILITHEHIDHVKSLPTISKKYNIPIYTNEKTWESIVNTNNIVTNNNIIFKNEENFEIGDLKILPFSTPHDAADPCGFNISDGNKKISIATDLGNMNSKIFKHLENSSFVMLESNYDPEVLKFSSYPYPLKRRIAGPTGHMENRATGQAICKLIDSGLKDVLLIHLSKENNFPELAYKTVVEEIQKGNFSENAININVAPRDNPSSLFLVS